MVNQEILEGLRTALSRGYSLESAMMSFFNSGYKKEEIEEAARALYTHPSQSLSHPGRATPEQAKKPVNHKAKPMETHEKTLKPETAESFESSEFSKPAEKKPKKFPKAAFEMPEEEKAAMKEKKAEKKPIKKTEVSKYEEKTKPKGKLITILLIFLLIFLVGALVGIFIFRDVLIDFFTNLF